MTIEEEVTSRMKAAMRAKDQQALSALRMVKTQAQAAKAAPGFDGKTDDAFWQGVIGRYVKQQTRARAEFEKAGEAGEEQVRQLTFEIDYFSEFLPEKLGADEVRALVEKAVAETGATGPKMVGKVMGYIMKQHRDQVEPDMVKAIALEVLG